MAFIIYPKKNAAYRKLQYFLAVLSLYTCSVSLFLKSFIAPLPLYVVIIETVVNVFFMVDIFLTFFVAYIDKTTLEVVDKKKEIFINAVKTVPLHIFMAFPFELLGMQHHPSSESYHIFTALCIIRLCRYLRVNHLLHEFEQNVNLNFTMVRLVKITLVCLFVCHFGGCTFYFVAKLHGNPVGTWFEVADENFLKLSLFVQYSNSIYWAVTAFTTVGFGDLHPVTTVEKIFSMEYLFNNIVVVAYVAGSITNLFAPDVGPTGRYRARRLRVLNFFRQYDLPTHLQNEVSNNLELEYVSKSEPSEEHGIFKSLPRPIREMILNYLYNIYVTDSYLFKEVSDAVRFQLIQQMEPAFFRANSTVILQNEPPTCFYFVVRGVVGLISFQDGEVGTVSTGDVFGQSCVLVNKPQLYTAKTRGACLLLKLDRDTLLDSFKDNAIVRSIIMNNEITKLQELSNPDFIEVLSEIQRRALFPH